MALFSLTTAPADALENIAFHLSTDTPCLLSLLQTSRAINQCLSVEKCPQLYARLFRFHFNLDCITRRLRTPLTDERLAAEFVQRFQVLRHIRLRHFSEDGLRTNLWTIYIMIMESDGLNERLLLTAGISEYILGLVTHRLGNEYIKHGWPLVTEINALALWIACLTTSPSKLFRLS